MFGFSPFGSGIAQRRQRCSSDTLLNIVMEPSLYATPFKCKISSGNGFHRGFFIFCSLSMLNVFTYFPLFSSSTDINPEDLILDIFQYHQGVIFAYPNAKKIKHFANIVIHNERLFIISNGCHSPAAVYLLNGSFFPLSTGLWIQQKCTQIPCRPYNLFFVGFCITEYFHNAYCEYFH